MKPKLFLKTKKVDRLRKKYLHRNEYARVKIYILKSNRSLKSYADFKTICLKFTILTSNDFFQNERLKLAIKTISLGQSHDFSIDCCVIYSCHKVVVVSSKNLYLYK